MPFDANEAAVIAEYARRNAGRLAPDESSIVDEYLRRNAGATPPALPAAPAPAPRSPQARATMTPRRPGDVIDRQAAWRVKPPKNARGDPNARTGPIERLANGSGSNGPNAPLLPLAGHFLKGAGGAIVGGVQALAHPLDAIRADYAARDAARQRLNAHDLLYSDPASPEAGEGLRDLTEFMLPVAGPVFAGMGRQMNSTDPTERAEGTGALAGAVLGPKAVESLPRVPAMVRSGAAAVEPSVTAARSFVGTKLRSRAMNSMLATGSRGLVTDALRMGKDPGLALSDELGPLGSVEESVGRGQARLQEIHDATQQQLQQPEFAHVIIPKADVVKAVVEPIQEAIDLAQAEGKSTTALRRMAASRVADIGKRYGTLDLTPAQLNEYKATLYQQIKKFSPNLRDADQTTTAIRQRQAHNMMQLVNQSTIGPEGVSPVQELNARYGNLAPAIEGLKEVGYERATKPLIPVHAITGAAAGGGVAGLAMHGVQAGVYGALAGGVAGSVREAFNSPRFASRAAEVMKRVAPAAERQDIRIPQYTPRDATAAGSNSSAAARPAPALPPPLASGRPALPAAPAAALREEAAGTRQMAADVESARRFNAEGAIPLGGAVEPPRGTIPMSGRVPPKYVHERTSLLAPPQRGMGTPTADYGPRMPSKSAQAVIDVPATAPPAATPTAPKPTAFDLVNGTQGQTASGAYADMFDARRAARAPRMVRTEPLEETLRPRRPEAKPQASSQAVEPPPPPPQSPKPAVPATSTAPTAPARTTTSAASKRAPKSPVDEIADLRQQAKDASRRGQQIAAQRLNSQADRLVRERARTSGTAASAAEALGVREKAPIAPKPAAPKPSAAAPTTTKPRIVGPSSREVSDWSKVDAKSHPWRAEHGDTIAEGDVRGTVRGRFITPRRGPAYSIELKGGGTAMVFEDRITEHAKAAAPASKHREGITND